MRDLPPSDSFSSFHPIASSPPASLPPLDSQTGEGGGLQCACVCVPSNTMTHFFHWDGIYITHQTQVEDAAKLKQKKEKQGGDLCV